MQRQAVRFRLSVLIVALVATGALAAVVPVVRDQRHLQNDWVRTVDGWERPTWRDDTLFEPGLHPAIPALGTLLVSIFCLVAFPGGGSEKVHSQPGQARRSIGPPHTHWLNNPSQESQATS